MYNTQIRYVLYPELDQTSGNHKIDLYHSHLNLDAE